jgi:SWI/SNF-related matrix-associated actin-dependent regulator 1 of chromatin subfamily A
MVPKVLLKLWNPPPQEPDLLDAAKNVPSGPRFEVVALGGLGSKYDDFKKARAGARYVPDHKTWVAEPEVAARIITRLEAAGFAVIVHPDVRAALDREVAIVEASLAAAQATLAQLEAVLARKGLALFDYQRRDVLWLASRKRAINCSEMGTGKTLVALASLPSPKKTGVIVCCPKTAKGVWRAQTAQWREDYRVTTLQGRGSFRYPEVGEMVVTNYEIVPNLRDLPTKPKHDIVLIGDEAHLLKNQRSQRSIRFARLSEVADRVLLLTGTPLPNKPSELWSLMMLCNVAHEAYGSYKEFCRLYSGTKKHFGGYDWGIPLPESGAYLDKVLIRHMKADVLDLPPKVHGVVEIDIEPEIAKLLDGDPETSKILRAKTIEDVPFNKISSLRMTLARAKIDAALELAESYEESETPVVFFSMHRAPIDALGKRPGWAAITGDTKDKERERIAADFQAGLLKGVAATIQAAATALTLTHATNEVFVDLSYVPSDNEQAEARCHRIGTTSSVTILHMVCDHAIDKHLRTLIAKKQGIIDASINDKSARQNKPDDLKALTPKLPPKMLPPDQKGQPRRPAANDAERVALQHVYLLAGLAGPHKVKVMQSHQRTALEVGADAMGSQNQVSEAQWRTVMWIEKQYAAKIKAAGL